MQTDRQQKCEACVPAQRRSLGVFAEEKSVQFHSLWVKSSPVHPPPPLLNFHGCVTSSSPGGGWLCWEMLFRALPRASPCAWEGRERWAAVVSCDAMKSEPLCIHRRHPSAVRRGGLRGDLTLHTHTHTHIHTLLTPQRCACRGGIPSCSRNLGQRCFQYTAEGSDWGPSWCVFVFFRWDSCRWGLGGQPGVCVCV